LSPLRRAQVLFLAIACTATYNSCSARTPAAAAGIAVDVFESSADLKESLQQKPALSFSGWQPSVPTITVNDAITYQQMDGFGASITDSSGWLIYNKLSTSQRADLMEKLFDPVNGIGLSFLRQPMGASDLALKKYSYDDLPPGQSDPALTQFSIDHDRAYILPVLRQAIALNPQLKIMATPWSPPGWMKSSDSLIKGQLLKSSYPALAKYFVTFVQAYAAEGVPIYAITMQNEPLFSPPDYPGTLISAEEQTTFIRDHLGPAFRDSGLTTKIMVFDHNWDLISYASTVLSDPKTASLVAGTAVHCYGGTVGAQTQLKNQFPDRDIWETECSGGSWQPGNLLTQQVGLVIGTTRNWAKSVVLWNLALDQNNGPYIGGCKTCRGLVTIDTRTVPSTTALTVDYVALGQASKFVSPGAYRIDSNSLEGTGLQNVAFRNPDGSIVLLALNSGGAPASFGVRWSGRSFAYTLEPSSTVTFRWRPVGQAGKSAKE
jgi:glucosylceramidase